MSKKRAGIQLIVKFGICVVLLLWIFNSIFTREARTIWPRLHMEGPAWFSLTRSEQWHAAWSLGPRELWKTLSMVSGVAFCQSLVAMAATIFLSIFRWKLVLRLQGLNLSLKKITEISFVSHFFNSFLLGSTGGDIIKAYYVARETKHKRTEAITTVFIDRALGLWTMMLFAVMASLLNLRLIRSTPQVMPFIVVVFGMFIACSAILIIAFWGERFHNILVRIPKGEYLEKSLRACRAFGQKPSFLLQSCFLSMLLNLVCVVQVMCLVRGLHLTISWLALSLIVPVIICVSAIPITPSGLGVRENLYVLMLAAPGIGIPDSSALAISLLTFADSLFWSVIGGFVYLFIKGSQNLDQLTAGGADELQIDS
ncbi:MAG: putative conserved rane protein [Verrucomicrobiales bacterium]|nr:putative conserved rane protein [Verrucomicrobiales bacterium]